MKTVSQGFKDALKNIKQIDTIISYNDGNETISLSNDDIQKVAIYWNTDLFKSCCKMLDLETSVAIPKDTELNVQFGIKVNNNFEYINYGSFYTVEEATYSLDTGTYITTAYDKMIKFNINASENPLSYQQGSTYTIKQLLQMVCTKCGVSYNFNLNSNTNANLSIIDGDYYKNNKEVTYRDILDDIAECLGTNFLINNNNEITNKEIDTTSLFTIDADVLKDTNVQIGEKKEAIDGIQVYDGSALLNFIGDDNSTFKIKDNNIVDKYSEQLLPYIFSVMEDKEYYAYLLNTFGVFILEPFDCFTVTYQSQNYSLLSLHNDIQLSGGCSEEISYEFKEEDNQMQYTTKSSDDKITNAYIEIDKQNGTIATVVEEVGEQNSKISRIDQSVEELNAKISDIADVTVTAEDTDGEVQLENINASEPINIKIHPTTESICCLYPRSNLYPSSLLFSTTRTLRFTNTSTNEVFDMILPEDLLYYNSANYDEFILDYENNTFRVNKKCKWNADGTVSLLTTPETHDHTYNHVNLTDGNYTIELLGYSNAYLYVRLMAANIYTSQFATKVELSSAINQTASEINLRVDEKLDEEEFTHAEIVAKINDNTSQVKIDADQVDIEANDVLNILAGNTLNLTSKAITIDSNHFRVDTNGNLYCTNANLEGTVHATNGDIGSFTLNSARLYSGSGNNQAGIGVYGIDYAFWAGNETSANAPFRVSHDGTLYASNAIITGNVNATNGTFTGTVSSSTINGSDISGGSISISRGNYYFNMGLTTSNPNCSGLNVGNYGIKANSGITATSFAITNGDTGKSVSLQVPRQGGGWYYLTFTGGILTAWERN